MVNKNIVVENARIIFRNFAGKEGKYNAPGDRNFCLCLDPGMATTLRSDGWNVKQLSPREGDGDPTDYIQVKVAFGYNPPSIYLINSSGKQKLEEPALDVLDWADIENVDLVVRPYNWEFGGKTGVKAYLKSMYVTIAEDEFAEKYRALEEEKHAYPQEDDDLPFV